jgi:type IV pilus assembly protein PilM
MRRAVGEAIRRAVKRSGARAKEVAVAISGDAAITKVIQMPRNLSEATSKARSRCRPTSTSRSRWKKSATTSKSSGLRRRTDMLDVLLVATRTENVEQRQAAVHAAGPHSAHRRRRGLRARERLQAADAPDARWRHRPHIAVVDFGASSTTFSVLRDLKVIYTRDFAFGGQQLTEEIMRTYGLSMEEAGRAKKEGGLPATTRPKCSIPFIDDMCQQVSRSLQFYLASGSAASSRRRS